MVARNTITAVVIATALSSGLDAQEVRSITLDEAIDMAVRVQPAMVSARGALDNALTGRREVTGSWLPNVSASSSMNFFPGSQSFTDPTGRLIPGNAGRSYSGSLSASLTIFDGFRRNAQGTAARADIMNAEASIESQRFSVVLQTKQAFFGVVEGAELVRVAERRIERAEQQLEISRNLLAAGSAIRSDTLRSTVELANAQLQRLNAETTRANQAATLARLIGYDGPVNALADGSYRLVMALDTAALRTQARQFSPSVQQAVASHGAAEAQVRVSRSSYFPSVTGSYSRSTSGSSLDALSGTWSARLSLSWPIFNGFSRESQLARARVQVANARAQMEDASRLVDAQLTQQFAAHESARLSIQIADASLAAAQEDLRVQQERYRVGLATIVDVLASQINVDQAETDEVQARFDMLLAQAAIESLIGGDL